jgi:hypothetical protein
MHQTSDCVATALIGSTSDELNIESSFTCSGFFVWIFSGGFTPLDWSTTPDDKPTPGRELSAHRDRNPNSARHLEPSFKFTSQDSATKRRLAGVLRCVLTTHWRTLVRILIAAIAFVVCTALTWGVYTNLTPAEPVPPMGICFTCVHGHRHCVETPALCTTDTECEQLTGIPVAE